MIILAMALTVLPPPVNVVPVAPDPDEAPIGAEIERVGSESVTELSFAIDANGAARNCMVEKSSGSERLDQEACIIILNRSRWTAQSASKASGHGNRRRMRIVWRIED